MGRKHLLVAIVAAAITAPWPVAVSVAQEPAVGSPTLPAPPDLDRLVAVLEDLRPPSRAPGEVAIRRVQQEPILRGGFVHAARATPGWGGEALVLARGVHSLEDVALAAGRPDLLVCRPDGCELRAPLLVRSGAGLVIRGSRDTPLRVRLHQDTGAFLINAGTLHIQSASILGWSSSQRALATTGGQRFRPFLAAFGASDTTIVRSELDHLGFEGAKAYGLSLSSHPRLFPGQRPSARLFANRFNQLYYGLYTYEARSVVVMANVFSDPHRYGIDPHDATSDLLIARNEIYGTQGHGLILSKHVQDSWIVENLSRDNAGSGLVVDASSTRNTIANNRLINNHRDGVAIYESHGNVISSNDIEGNGGAGIRIRASEANFVANNTITGSGEYGLTAYGWSGTAKPPTPEQEKFRRPVSLTLLGNSFADNAQGACQFKSVGKVIAYSDPVGDLKPCGDTLSILSEQPPNRRWRLVPGRPEAARLVVQSE